MPTRNPYRVPFTEETDGGHPVLGPGLGAHAYAHAVLGERGGMTRFGVHLETLHPGSRSSSRHWHETQDEIVLVLSGEVILVEDTDTVLGPGDCAAWPLDCGVGHCLWNRGLADTTYLVVGTRSQRDRVHYPDDDLIGEVDGAARRWLHADGRPRHPSNL